MNLFFRSLASGSSGNSAVIYTAKTKILIDCGISRKRIKESLSLCSIDFSDLDAIFITHAHHDHVAGLPVLIKHTTCLVYCSRRVFEQIKRKSNFTKINEFINRFRFFEDGIDYDDLKIDLCKLPHDGWLLNGSDTAGDHYGFVFTHKNSGARLGFATDMGHFPEEHFKTYYNCDFYFIESNHDVNMQKKSPRPMGLIKRNLSKFGHLSNEQCSEAVVKFIPQKEEQRKTKNIVLAHLSQECNYKDLACDVVANSLKNAGIEGVNVVAAPCKQPGELVVI